MVISVIVATRNRGPQLKAMLDAFTAVEPPLSSEWELMVVDNNSSDDTSRVLGEFVRRGILPLRQLFEARRGKSCALNTAIRQSRGDVLAFTDDDAIVDRLWLRNMERVTTEHHAHIGFGGPAVATGVTAPPAHGNGIVNYHPSDHAFVLEPFTVAPPGVNFFFRRTAFQRYGLFREDLGPGSPVQRSEDTDFVRRLWLAGEHILYTPDVLVHHPVDLGRLHWRYTLKWMFWVGRSNARMTGRSGLPTLAGVPRWLFPSILRKFASVAIPFPVRSGGPRIERAQQLFHDLGLAYEFWRLDSDFDPQRMVPRLVEPAPSPSAHPKAQG